MYDYYRIEESSISGLNQVCFHSGYSEWLPLQKSAMSYLLGFVCFVHNLRVNACKAFLLVIFYLCVFYEEIKNHPVSFYIHSFNALGEPALILINPLGRSISLEKKYFTNVFITKLCFLWTTYFIPKQDIVLSWWHGCKFEWCFAVFDDACCFSRWILLLCCNLGFHVLLSLSVHADFTWEQAVSFSVLPWFCKKEQIVKITTFWFLVIHGLHQNLRRDLDWFLSMYSGSFLFTEQISISIVLMLCVSVMHKSI